MPEHMSASYEVLAGASTAPSLQMAPSGGGTLHLMHSCLSWQPRGRSSSAVPIILTAMTWPAALIRAGSGFLTLLRRPCCKNTSSTGRECCRSCTCPLASCSSAWVSSHHCLVWMVTNHACMHAKLQSVGTELFHCSRPDCTGS